MFGALFSGSGRGYTPLHTVDSSDQLAAGSGGNSTGNPSSTSLELTQKKSQTVCNTKFRDFAADYDICLVFPAASDGCFTEIGNDIIQQLLGRGFELFAYHGLRQDKIFVLLRTPVEVLRASAAMLDYTMELDSTIVNQWLAAGNSTAGIAPVRIAHRPDITRIHPYDFIYAKYSQHIPEVIYARWGLMRHPFRDLHRLKLQYMMLFQTKRSDGSLFLNIPQLRQNHHLLSVFPLHDNSLSDLLEYQWSQFPFQYLPLNNIKEYFGENIGLYFAFMQHFILFLSVPGIIGLPLQLLVNNIDVTHFFLPIRPIFSLFIVLWAIVMLEFWKRKEKTIAMKWGTIDFEKHEFDRAEYFGELADSFVDGSKVRYYPTQTRRWHIGLSLLPIGAFILIAVGIVASIYIVRYTIQPTVGPIYGQIFASLTNTIQIQYMNKCYGGVAKRLTERENYRTDTEYEDSMIAKIFVFQFTNSYASFFYIAFIAELIGKCPPAGCMWPLALNLMIVFGTKLLVSNWFQIGAPYIHLHQKNAELEELERVAKKKMSRPEQEFLLEEYDQLSARLGDYSEIAIGFGYLSLFGTSLPVVSTFLFVSLIIGLKGDAWKLANLHQRTFPINCEDIGTWQSVFLLLSIIAVVTNAGMCVYTMHELDSWSRDTRFWIFIGFQWLCFTLQAVIMEMIPDIPEAVEIQLQRQEFIVRKLIDRVPDENEEEECVQKVTTSIPINHYPGA